MMIPRSEAKTSRPGKLEVRHKTCPSQTHSLFGVCFVCVCACVCVRVCEREERERERERERVKTDRQTDRQRREATDAS